jgi:hypothetical protein
MNREQRACPERSSLGTGPFFALIDGIVYIIVYIKEGVTHGG